MPRRQFEDVSGGSPITLDVVTDDGYLLPAFRPLEQDGQDNFDSLPRKKCRDDDILLCSYPKTGTNWLWEMMTMVLIGQSHVTNKGKGPGMLEALPEEKQDELASPRILNTHVKYKYIPKEARQKRIKCVFLCRNPKDTVVSFYNHTTGISLYQYEGKWKDYLAMFMRGEVDYGSYPEYLLEWQHVIRDNPDWPIHVMYYEDLKKNCFEEMKRLCQYLEKDVSDDLLQEIVDNCQIDKLKRGKNEQKTQEAKEWEKKHLINNFSLYRKGQIGDWKNWFTVSQSEAFDRWWADSTKSLDMFTFRYS